MVSDRAKGTLLPNGARDHAGQGPRQAGADDAIGCHEGHRRLAAEHRRREYIGRDHKAKIAGGVDVQIQICVDGNVGRNPAEREFTRTRDVGAGGYGGMVVDIRQRPTRLLRRGREASKEAGDPEADAFGAESGASAKVATATTQPIRRMFDVMDAIANLKRYLQWRL